MRHLDERRGTFNIPAGLQPSLHWSLQLERAELHWERGEGPLAMGILKTLLQQLGAGGDPVSAHLASLRPTALCLYGSWLAESHSKNPVVVMETYLEEVGSNWNCSHTRIVNVCITYKGRERARLVDNTAISLIFRSPCGSWRLSPRGTTPPCCGPTSPSPAMPTPSTSGSQDTCPPRPSRPNDSCFRSQRYVREPELTPSCCLALPRTNMALLQARVGWLVCFFLSSLLAGPGEADLTSL